MLAHDHAGAGGSWRQGSAGRASLDSQVGAPLEPSPLEPPSLGPPTSITTTPKPAPLGPLPAATGGPVAICPAPPPPQCPGRRPGSACLPLAAAVMAQPHQECR